jgi:hypothetical protein
MGHSLIFGMTESGKTSLAKYELIPRYQANNIKVLVLDPMNDPGWNADFQTDNVDEFLKVYWASRQCAVFIDEAGESVGRFDSAMITTATKGRHWGHKNHYLSQRGAMLSKTVRDQCSDIFLFTTSLDDCKVHANEWNAPELKEANSLAQLEYFHTGRFTDVTKGKIIFDLA